MGDKKADEDESRMVVTSAKKLYSTIQELGVQIDSLSSRCLEVEDLFSHDLQAKRLALKDCCESLFNLSPKTYGAVSRERLWRVALYDAVNRARKIQRDRQWTPVQLDLLQTHLQSGIGVLKLYIMRLKDLCESSSDPIALRAGVLDSWCETRFNPDGNNMTHGDREKTWITDLVHLCLINIGDLHRYLKEVHSKAQDPDLIFDSTFYFTGAQTHYLQAFLLRPESGLAFNQLGNLYSDSTGSLHSVYYLLYSVQSANTYEGSFSNLRQLLDRRIVQFARLPASVEPKPMDTLVNNIFSLMYHFLYEHTHLQNYERHCQEALTNFNERLVTCDPELDEQFLYHLSSICVMMVWRLQSANSVHTSAAVAFAISIFCQLINHLTAVLEQHSRVRQCRQTISAPVTPSPLQSDIDQISVASSNKIDKEEIKERSEDDSSKNNGFMVPKRRRRRRDRENSDSESEGSECRTPDFVYSDEEELENSGDSDDEWLESDDDDMDFDGSIPDEEYDKISERNGSDYRFKIKARAKAFDSSSSNGHSDTSGSGVQGNEVIAVSKESETDINRISDKCSSIGIGLADNENDKQKFMIAKEDLLKCRSQVEAVLVALSPFLRWIQTCSVIKDALAANAEKAFLEKLCSALNLLASQNWPVILDGVSVDELKNDWKKLCQGSVNEKNLFKLELDEDRSMLGIPQLQEFVKNLQIKPVTEMDSLVIRMGRMVAFGSWLVSTESFSILYTPEELCYFIPSPQTLKAYLLQSKLKRLKERLGNCGDDEIDKLSKAYNEMKMNRSLERGSRRMRQRNRDDDGDGTDTRRGRRRRGRRGRGPPSREPVYAVVDLQAILKKCKDVKRVASHRKFIVVIPYSVWKTLDMLKDSEEEDSKNARIAFRWLEAALKRRHPGLVLQKDQQKLEINFPYPKDPSDLDAWEYFDMMECCNYIIATWLKNKPRSTEVVWGDVRDKCKVFFLTGHEDLLNTRIPRSFDPVKIARNVGIFVDYIVPYPGIGRGNKWKSVAKTNG